MCKFGSHAQFSKKDSPAEYIATEYMFFDNFHSNREKTASQPQVGPFFSSCTIGHIV